MSNTNALIAILKYVNSLEVQIWESTGEEAAGKNEVTQHFYTLQQLIHKVGPDGSNKTDSEE